MLKVGFIGLGNVGGKLAGSLLRNGIDLTVRDLDPAIAQPFLDGGANIKDNKTNKESLDNKRAQYYMELRRRVWNTYCAVTKDKYTDPDTMISFDTESIDPCRSLHLRS